jgi:hypothetical protein
MLKLQLELSGVTMFGLIAVREIDEVGVRRKGVNEPGNTGGLNGVASLAN